MSSSAASIASSRSRVSDHWWITLSLRDGSCYSLVLCCAARLLSSAVSSEFDPLEKWDVSYARNVKSTLRLTMSQVRRCYEIFKLNSVSDRHKQSKPMVAYRLEVKARLFHAEQEVLALYSQRPEERKEKLAEMYNELEQHYLAVMKKARLHQHGCSCHRFLFKALADDSMLRLR